MTDRSLTGPAEYGSPILYRKIDIPHELCTTADVNGRLVRYAGDVRMGDLRGVGEVDFLVYRSVDNAHDGGGMKPCFMAALTIEGDMLWRVGSEGEQPTRPGPVAIHDIDGDGCAEVVCFFLDASVESAPTSMANVVIQIRNGSTGAIRLQTSPAELQLCHGEGANWAHQRLLAANFRGTDQPRDLVVKLGSQVIAFDETLRTLWTYENPWTEYGRCPAYIPAVGDIDGDGRDEVNGGYFLLDHDGTVLWERQLAQHMDSVAITEWDDHQVRAICSGSGHVMDHLGNVVLCLGKQAVPHGQEVRVARFGADDASPQMVIRYNGHAPDVIVVDTRGVCLNRFQLNVSTNNTGMEVVYWNGLDRPALLYNGGKLWAPIESSCVELPNLPSPEPVGRMAWYHCIPADVCGDEREELVLYNPWDPSIFIYTPYPLDSAAFEGFRPGARQYNARLIA